ncbi:MAG TPA: hypothetical protein VG944_04910 [Fimbriimonas sp.]|nr:hypothetical protein [Fimbriimonas sp.]
MPGKSTLCHIPGKSGAVKNNELLEDNTRGNPMDDPKYEELIHLASNWGKLVQLAIETKLDVPKGAEEKYRDWFKRRSARSVEVLPDQELVSILAGVLPPAVSTAISGTRNSQLARRIRTFAKMLGVKGRMLPPSEYRGRLIAVAMELLAKPSWSYTQEVLTSIVQEISRAGGHVALYDVPADWQQTPTGNISPRTFFTNPPDLRRCEGLILINTQASQDELEEMARAFPRLPIVLVHDNQPLDREYAGTVVANILPDLDSCLSGFRQLIIHLLGPAHRAKQLVFVTVSEGGIQTRSTKRRVFEEECRKAHAEFTITEVKLYSLKEGSRIAAYGTSDSADCFVCMSDVVAVGIKSALRHGTDALVTGFDDNLASAFGMSSVDQGLSRIGPAAIKVLEEKIASWRSGLAKPPAAEITVETVVKLRCCDSSRW